MDLDRAHQFVRDLGDDQWRKEFYCQIFIMESKEDGKLAKVGDGRVPLKRQVEGRIIILGFLVVEKCKFFLW